MNATFVLVRPRYPGNIGAAARALKNMGFSKLALVAPRCDPCSAEAQRMAVGASDILKKAKIYPTLDKAVAPLQYLVGTSRRLGRHRQNFVSLVDLPPQLPKGKIGILFGPEEKGLSNEEIACCHTVAVIPSSPKYPSLNLAQSVMVVAYELRKLLGWGKGDGSFLGTTAPSNTGSRLATRRAASQGLEARLRMASKISTPSPQPPVMSTTMDQIEGMFQQLEATLAEIGFFPHGNPFLVMRTLRNLFGRSGLTPREIRIFRGLCRQILWYGRNA